MKKDIIFRLIAIVGICILTFACTNLSKNTLPEPTVHAGTAKLSGKIIGYYPGMELILTVPTPITMELDRRDVKVEDDGTFSVEVSIETNPAIGYVYNMSTEQGFTINLEADKETQIVIDNDSISVVSGPHFYTENNTHMTEMMIKAAQSSFKYDILNKELLDSCAENPMRYIPINQYDLNKRLDIFLKDSLLSEQSKIFSTYYLKSLHVGSPLQFSEEIENIHMNIRKEGDTTTIKVNKPDLSYYTFLKEYDLGNPYHLYSEFYGGIFQTIHEVFKIPEINETPIKEWLAGVKNTMADLIGADKGLFYDMIISQAYMRQLVYQMEPLSDKQIQNIQEYFGNAEIAKIILRKNDEVKRLAANKGKTIINETPSVAKEKLLKAITDKYKGKVILVDFWATWCGPCIGAMKEMLPLKHELKDKDAVFIYITNPSSPTKLWEEKVKAIDGEHYYLTEEEWNYISNDLNIEGIPTYLIYDKDGNMKDKMTGYPGTESMKKKIVELL